MSRAKGTPAETAVVRYLQDQGWPNVERRALAGAKDRGDIAGLPGVTVEVKNVKELKLAEMVDEAVTEAANAGTPVGVLWHKRRGKGQPADWYVTMTGAHFVRLLKSYCGTL